MTEELYINNQRVDMNADTKITLNFKSNLLGDISKITSSNSQTISLPKTNHNRNIFDDPTSPSRSSMFPRRKHPARYVKNGVTVIADAYVVLLDCSDKYEIALYWGEMTKFQTWVNSGAKLNDLTGLSSIYQIWDRSTTEPDGGCFVLSDGRIGCPSEEEEGLFYAGYDTGVGSWWTMNSAAQAVVAPFPFLSARKLISLIESDVGITFQFPDGFINAKYGILRRLAVHLSTRKTSVPQTKSATITGFSSRSGSTMDHGGIRFTMPSSAAYTVEERTIDPINTYGDKCDATVIKSNVGGRMRVFIYTAIGKRTGKWEHQNWSDDINGSVLSIYKNGARGSADVHTVRLSRKVASVENVGTWYIYETLIGLSAEIDVVKGDEIAFIVDAGQLNGKFYEFSGWDDPIKDTRIQVTPPAAEINASLGEYFRTKGNLPDIRQLDFIKAIAAMFGLCVMPSGVANRLQFASLDDLLENISDAVDWSAKLISNGDGDPSKIKFTWSDYCRRNKFVYKSTDDVTASGDGEILIDNDALDAEKEVIKLPFTPSDEVIVKTDVGERGVIIPHLEKGNDGQITDKKVDPRVVLIVPDAADTGKAIARFTPISFTQLIDTYYQTMRRLLNDAVVITEKFRLNEFDLLSLDFMKPVYLRQYGKYYGVVSVQATGDECTVELVQLPSSRAGVGGVLYSTDGGQSYTATVPTNPVNLKVFTLGATIGNEDIRTLSEIDTLKRLDLTDVEFVDPDTGTIIGNADGKTVLFDDNAEHIAFPRNVSAIGDECCQGLTNLRTVALPPHLESIGYESFDSSRLRAVVIPASLTELKQHAFWSCRYMHTIVCRALTVPDTASAVFSNVGAYIYGDKRVFVPDVDTYENDEIWGLLASNYGFTFHPLSEADDRAVNEIRLTPSVADKKVTATATAPVASAITIEFNITRSGQTLTQFVTIPQGKTTAVKSVDFDSVTIRTISVTSDSTFRYALVLFN